MRTVLGLVSVGMAIAVMAGGASTAHAQTAHILDYKVIGSGCPAGLTATIDTGNALIIAFGDNYVVSIGEGNGGKTLDRKGCTVSVLLDTPVGYSYALSSLHSFGTAVVAPDSIGTHQTKYWFQGSQATSYSASFVDSGNWWIDDSFANPVFSSCHLTPGDQRYLDITTSLSLSARPGWDPSNTSTIVEYFQVGTTYDLAFVPCP